MNKLRTLMLENEGAVVETAPRCDLYTTKAVEIEEPYYDVDTNTIIRYEIVEKTEDEKKKYLNQVKASRRRGRNAMLASADTLVLKYVEEGKSVPQNILEYKQELRDMTELEGFPFVATPKLRDLTAKEILITTVEAYIQEPVDAYNEANGTLFASVHNCGTYINVPEYSHYDFCVAIVKFNADVWEVGRGVETQVFSGEREMPTVEGLINELPKFGV